MKDEVCFYDHLLGDKPFVDKRLSDAFLCAPRGVYAQSLFFEYELSVRPFSQRRTVEFEAREFDDSKDQTTHGLLKKVHGVYCSESYDLVSSSLRA